ncbi:MAG: EscU/YscU/HrcU family type III secretion system export apparatus switch protein, partial [Rhodobacteraceae bacterium]|nr:EscU/YscU/HrcU family type III secretion system export apparatus switch protein [Paracoccaceae bacterium]
MSGQDDAAEKEHDPSQRKLDEARRKGEVPRSADLTTAAAQGGMLLTVLLLGPWMLRRLGEAGAALLGGADRLAPQMAA